MTEEGGFFSFCCGGGCHFTNLVEMAGSLKAQLHYLRQQYLGNPSDHRRYAIY
jgi:hypothetical protein